MTKEFRTMLDELESTGMPKEALVNIQIINEFVTNKDFRGKLQDYVFETTYKKNNHTALTAG